MSQLNDHLPGNWLPTPLSITSVLASFSTSLLCQVPTCSFRIQFGACSFASLVMPQINARLGIVLPCKEHGWMHLWATFRFSKVKERTVLETPKQCTPSLQQGAQGGWVEVQVL